PFGGRLVVPSGFGARRFGGGALGGGRAVRGVHGLGGVRRLDGVARAPGPAGAVGVALAARGAGGAVAQPGEAGAQVAVGGGRPRDVDLRAVEAGPRVPLGGRAVRLGPVGEAGGRGRARRLPGLAEGGERRVGQVRGEVDQRGVGVGR